MTGQVAGLPQLWIARTDGEAEAVFEPWLDPGERARLLRFTHPGERRRRTVAWGLRRWALSRVQPAIAETEWRFAVGAFGKPELAPAFAALDLHHSLSHGEIFATVLVSKTPCGVDVEAPPAGREAEAVVFSHHEREAIAAHAHPHEAFLQHWVAKEAVLKLIGTGLGDGPERLSIDIGSDGREAHVRMAPFALPPRLTIRLWPLPEGHRLGAAFEGPAPDLEPRLVPTL